MKILSANNTNNQLQVTGWRQASTQDSNKIRILENQDRVRMQINGTYWGADNWTQKATLACSSTLYPILPKSGDTGEELVIKVDAAGKVYIRSYSKTYIEETIYMVMDWPKG